MLYLVCYDISDDKIRYQVSERLLDFGARIQESVFECLLDGEQYERMVAALDRIRLDELDKVRIYKVCANCVEAVKIYGPGEVSRDPDFYLV
jgi:CRISPR-associated protein Cas2